MRVYIDGDWDTFDFVTLLDSITRLHNYYDIADVVTNQFINFGEQLNWPTILPYLPEVSMLAQDFKREADIVFTSQIRKSDFLAYSFLRTRGACNMALRVEQIKFGSPGNVDFLGFGKAFESIKEVLFHYFPNAETRKNIELKQTEIEMKEQEILSKKIDNLNKMGFSQIEVQKLIGLEYNHIEKLISLKKRNQIINIEVEQK